MSDGLVGGLAGAIITGLLALISYLVFFGRQFEKISKLEDSQKRHKGKIEEFDKAIATLEEFKTNAQKFIDHEVYKTDSPLSLTDFGEKLVKESGFDGIFEKEKDSLVEKLEAKAPTTQYDVQEKSRALMDELVDYEPFQAIKKYAFENGRDFRQILRAGAIPLRDYYLSKHPEITS